MAEIQRFAQCHMFLFKATQSGSNLPLQIFRKLISKIDLSSCFLMSWSAEACQDLSKTHHFAQFGCLSSILYQKTVKKVGFSFQYTFNKVILHQITSLFVIWNCICLQFTVVNFFDNFFLNCYCFFKQKDKFLENLAKKLF